MRQPCMHVYQSKTVLKHKDACLDDDERQGSTIKPAKVYGLGAKMQIVRG